MAQSDRVCRKLARLDKQMNKLGAMLQMKVIADDDSEFGEVLLEDPDSDPENAEHEEYRKHAKRLGEIHEKYSQPENANDIETEIDEMFLKKYKVPNKGSYEDYFAAMLMLVDEDDRSKAAYIIDKIHEVLMEEFRCFH